MKADLQRLWPHLRALFVALHVGAVLLLALPNPNSALDRRGWESRTVQQELARWGARLGVEPGALERRLYAAVQRWSAVRAGLLAPLEPYHRYLGIRQPWTMFAAPHRDPARLEIEVQEDGRWQTVYVARSETHDWLADVLDHDRMRAVVFRHTWPQYAGSHRHFVHWLGRRAAVDFPRSTHLRARFYRARTPSPEEVRAGVEPEGRYEGATVVPLR